MPIHEHYETGAPCWVDYGALDPMGARAFYGELFGWTFRTPDPHADAGADSGSSGGYAFIELAGQVVGGFGRVPPGLPAAWNTYLATEDAGAVAVRVRALGGRVVFGPVAAGHDGRLLFAIDPAGAAVGFWEGHRPAGVVLVDEPGTWCGHELWSGDPAFYGALFGADGATSPDGLPDTTARDVPASGAGAQWVTFFMTRDRVATVRAAVRLEATIVARRRHATIMRDPWGALLALA